MDLNVLTYDLETRVNPAEVGWENYKDMGISIGCGHCNWLPKGVENPRGQYFFFGEESFEAIYKMVKFADVITGFNIKKFDNPLLVATAERLGYTLALDELDKKSYDMYEDIQQSLGKREKGWKLDQVATSTIHTAKMGDGAAAPKLFQEGKVHHLTSYVLQDVMVERELFEHIVKFGVVKSDDAPSKKLKLQLYKEITDPKLV